MASPQKFQDPAQVGPQWIDKFGRVRTPRAEYHDDHGNVYQGAEAGLKPRHADYDDGQEGSCEAE